MGLLGASPSAITLFIASPLHRRFTQGGRTPHGADHLHRPDLEVSAAIAHGVGLYVFVADPNVPVGSNHTLECLSQSLAYARQRLSQLGRILPDHLHVQLDNTTSQNKNSLIQKVHVTAKRCTLALCQVVILRDGHGHKHGSVLPWPARVCTHRDLGRLGRIGDARCTVCAYSLAGDGLTNCGEDVEQHFYRILESWPYSRGHR